MEAVCKCGTSLAFFEQETQTVTECPNCGTIINWEGETNPTNSSSHIVDTNFDDIASAKTIPSDQFDSGETNAESAKERKQKRAANASASTSGQWQLEKGQFFAHYQIESILGRGGMGIVYRARDTKLNRIVALKLILSSFDVSKKEKLRFIQETKAAAQVQHSNIVRLFEAGDSPQSYYTMEYIEGETLTRLIREDKLTPKETAEILRKTALALHAAHQSGIIHRDVKPGNIIIEKNSGEPKVMDFGLAKITTADSQLSRTGEMLGTPAYMSPEQAEGEKVDHSTDIYSLGATLYEMLAKRPPFQGRSYVNIIQQIFNTDPIPPRQLDPDTSQDLEAIALKCLEKSRENRYQDAKQVADDLQRFLDGKPVTAKPFTRWTSFKKLVLRNKLPFAAGFLAMLLAIAGISFYIYAITEEQRRTEQARQNALTEAKKARDAEKLAMEQAQKAKDAEKLAWDKEAMATVSQQRALAAEQQAMLEAKKARGAEQQAMLEAKKAHTAEQQATLEAQKARDAEQKTRTILAKSLVSQGDALGMARRWKRAKELYLHAEHMLEDIGEPTFLAHLGVWNANVFSPPELNTFRGHESVVEDVEFFQNCRRAISASRDGTLRIWSVMEGEEQMVLRGHSQEVFAVALNKDESKAISASGDFTLKIWEIATGKELRTLEGHAAAVVAVELSSDDRWIVSASLDNTIKIWDNTTCRETKTLSGHLAPVTSISIFPNNRYIASASRDRTLKIWDIETGRQIATLSGHSKSVECVAVSADGKYILSGGADKKMCLWDAGNGKLLHVFVDHGSAVRSVAFSPDSQQALSASWDKTARLWDLKSKREIYNFSGHALWVESIAFASRGDLAMSGGWDNEVKLWSLLPGDEVRSVENHREKALCAALSPDARLVISGGQDRYARLSDVATGKQLVTYKGHRGGITGVAFSADYIATASTDKTVRLWRLDSTTAVKILKKHRAALTSVAFSPDGKHLFSSSRDRSMIQWDVASGRILHTFSIGSEVLAVTVSSDGNLVATADKNGKVQIWQVKTGKIAMLLSGHSSFVDSVAFSPDGKYLISAGGDKAIILWDVASGHQQKVFLGHTDWVSSIAFASSGRYILSGSKDDTVRIWSVETGLEIRSLAQHDGWVRSVTMSPDQQLVVSASYDGSVKIWDFSRAQKYLEFARNDTASKPENIGLWFTFRGIWDWGIEVLEARGKQQDALILARNYWQMGNTQKARENFRQAQKLKLAPEYYLQLCLQGVR